MTLYCVTVTSVTVSGEPCSYPIHITMEVHFNVSQLFRVNAGEMCAFGPRNEVKLRVNFMHCSKENIASVPSSYILPKGSPLEVGTNIGAQMTLGKERIFLTGLV